MEGTVSGLHRSPYHGFSVEFAQHREYTHSDDIRHLDWKVFGRTDKLYVKEYEQETNLEGIIALDVSSSMLYSSNEISKLEYACYLTAGISYLLKEQQDALGIAFFDNKLKNFLRASTNPVQFKNVLLELEKISAEEKTDLSHFFTELSQKLTRRSLIFILSDLFADFNSLKKGLELLSYRRHEIVVFNVLDPYELTFPFYRLTQFEALEDTTKLRLDPKPLRKAYLEIVNEFIKKLKSLSIQLNTDYVVATTDVPVDITLSRYFVARMSTRKFKRAH